MIFASKKSPFAAKSAKSDYGQIKNAAAITAIQKI